MATIISTTFRLKRGLAEKWQELNLVLDPGEPGFELDTYRLKIGDGQTPWNDLPYIGYNGGGGGEGIIVDTVLSNTSLNPIANKTVKAALDRLEALIGENDINYEFGNGFKVTENNGIKSVEIDLEVLSSLIDTSNFATKEEMRELARQFSELAAEVQALAASIKNLKVPTKLGELENDVGYLTEHQDLSGYALKTDIPSLEGLATETFVQQKIAEAQLAGGEVDLSNYYTKEEVDNLIPDVTKYVTTEYIIESQNALKTELEKTIDDKIAEEIVPNAIEYGTF
jgi:hypothetical protein